MRSANGSRYRDLSITLLVLCLVGGGFLVGCSDEQDQPQPSPIYDNPLDVPMVKAGSVGKCVPFKLESGRSICLLDKSQYASKGTPYGLPETSPTSIQSRTLSVKVPPGVTSVDLYSKYVAKCSGFRVHDQDNTTWCVAHATLGAVEIKMCIDRGAVQPMSEPYLWHLGHKPDPLSVNLCEKGGWYIQNAVKKLKSEGTLPSSVWPFYADSKDCEPNIKKIIAATPKNLAALDSGKRKYRISSAANVPPQDVDGIKQLIYAKYPVIYNFLIQKDAGWEKDYESNIGINQTTVGCLCESKNKALACPNDPGCIKYNHAVVIVGFDDTRKWKSGKGTGQFRVLNSYGQKKGWNGTVWVDYPYVKEFGGGGVGVVETACEGECSTAGYSKCEGGVRSTCQVGTDGCRTWGKPFACPAGCANNSECRKVAPDAGVPDAATPDMVVPDASPLSVAAPKLTSPTACQVMTTSNFAKLSFSVSSLAGIDKFTFNVKEATGCNKAPTGGNINGYPTTGSAVSPKTYTLGMLLPGKWYKFSIESTAKAGYKSANTVGWFKTASLPVDAAMPDGSAPDAGVPDAPAPKDVSKPDAPIPDAPTPVVAAPQISAPAACQVLGTATSAVMKFSVSSLAGIDKFTFVVKETAGCNKQPTGGNVSGYPTTGSAVTPKTYTLNLLSPGKWYKYSIESTAKAGWQSSNTVGWFQTAALQPDAGVPDLSPPDAAMPDAASPDAGGNKDWGTVVPGTWTTIPGGTFQMGSPSSESCRSSNETQHQVTLTHKFEIQATEVTQGQFTSLMGYSPSYFSNCGGTCPVEQVNWHEAAAYANALSAQKGKAACYACTGSGKSVTCSEATAYAGKKVYTCPGYRLPTEAEWEFAYRAATSTAFYNGGITSCYGTDPNLDKIGWYDQNSGNKTHPVGQKTPNAWGLYDMAGNVYEWCHDWYNSSYGSSAVTDPVGTSGSARVNRGGGWYDYAWSCRAADRSDHSPGYRFRTLGFRLARSVP